jgi:hypothetical protein
VTSFIFRAALLQICYRYPDAFHTLRSYLARFPAKVIGGGSTGKPALKLEAVLEAVRGLTSAQKLSAIELKKGIAADVAPYQSMPDIFDAGHIQVQIPGMHTHIARHLSADASLIFLPSSVFFFFSFFFVFLSVAEGDTKKADPKTARNPYTDEQLNLLAICFTAVKILYISGALQPIPALVTLLGTAYSTPFTSLLPPLTDLLMCVRRAAASAHRPAPDHHPQ